MSNFYELLLDVLNERGKSFQDLENAGVIASRSFYKYKTFTPYLIQILKIANYLNVSLDYMADRTSTNKFKKYNLDKISFYDTLNKLLKDLKISQSKLSKDLNIGRTNFTYWKNGSYPKFSTLISIADYLHCSIDDLLY